MASRRAGFSSAREGPGQRLGVASLGQMSHLGRAGRPYPRHVSTPSFCAGNPSPNPNPYPNPTTGFCAENPTKEHICKNKQLLHFKSINQIPPFNKPASKPGAGAAAPKRKLD